MGKISYPEVLTELLSALPEIRPRYEKDAWLLSDWQGAPTLYSVFGLVLKPFLTEALDLNKDSSLLTRIFEFLERMASSRDTEVINLLGVGIFEDLVCHPNQLATAWKYMGPETRKIARKIARASRREANVPRG